MCVCGCMGVGKRIDFLLFANKFKNYSLGIFDCLKKMYKSEGFFAYWKGIVPPILVETPKRAVKVSFLYQ